MSNLGGVTPRTESPQRRVLCSPYHLYTHRDVLACLFEVMQMRDWETSLLLPFTVPSTLARMTAEAAEIPNLRKVHDFTVWRWVGEGRTGTPARSLRAAALAWYFARVFWLLIRSRPDVLLLTSDLGGVSVRFIQLVASRLGIPIITIQSTLFLRVAEREDLKFELKPRWIHRLLSKGIFKKLFLYFGEVPGSFLAHSHVAVQDDEIRRICIEFGKKPSHVVVFGSLQAARIRAHRSSYFGSASDISTRKPHVLLLSECVGERFGETMEERDFGWLYALVLALHPKVDFSVRFHPRESADYRRRFAERFGMLCSIDPAADAVEAAAMAHVIVGTLSMLMFDAQAAGVSTVFLDVGMDPIGFYNNRRQPLANSSEQLVELVTLALATTEPGSITAATEPLTWGTSIVDWMTGLLRDAEN